MKAYTFAPGAVSASTATALPSDAPQYQIVTSVLVQTEASGGTASTTSPTEATVVYSIPGGGLGSNDFYLDPDKQEWQYGSATTSGTVFDMHGLTIGEVGLTA